MIAKITFLDKSYTKHVIRILETVKDDNIKKAYDSIFNDCMRIAEHENVFLLEIKFEPSLENDNYI
jgi:hypothetical protein